MYVGTKRKKILQYSKHENQLLCLLQILDRRPIAGSAIMKVKPMAVVTIRWSNPNSCADPVMTKVTVSQANPVKTKVSVCWVPKWPNVPLCPRTLWDDKSVPLCPPSDNVRRPKVFADIFGRWWGDTSEPRPKVSACNLMRHYVTNSLATFCWGAFML